MIKNKKSKFLPTIISTLIISLGLTACTDKSEQKEKTASEVQSTASEPIIKTETGLVYDDNVEVSPEVEKMILEYLDGEIKAGRIKPEDIKNDEIIRMGKILTISLEEAKKNNNTHMNSLETINHLYNDKPDNVSVSKKVDSYDSKESEELGKKIKNTIPNTIINEIKKIENAPYFSVTINNSPIPLYTTSKADYYFIPDNPSLGRFSILGKDGKQILFEDVAKSSIVYKDVIAKLDKSKLAKVKYGKGEKELFIFTDPDCPYCKKQDDEIFNNFTNRDNVTIYYVMNPLLSLHPNAHIKAAQILCSDNPSDAWISWQKDGKLVDKKADFNETTCVQKVADQSIYADLMGLNATPTLISEHGLFMQGVLDVDTLRAFITLTPKNVIDREKNK